MRFERLDLNLLVSFDVLVEERSVSAAAKRLNLSQPALSGALNRLRDFFEDELLVQSGRQMILTPKAIELMEPVREALLLIRTRITTPAQFDPATAIREFTIVASDYLFNIFLAEVLADLTDIAPGLSFEITPPEASSVERLERGDLDLLMTIHTHLVAHHPSRPLFSDEHAIICWSESKYRDGVDVETFLSARHAVACFGPTRLVAYSEAWFTQQNIPRGIDIRVPAFTFLPQAVIGTDRLATMQRRYAEYYARTLPITVLPMPFALPHLQERVQWHTMRSADAGLSWLVDLIGRRAADI